MTNKAGEYQLSINAQKDHGSHMRLKIGCSILLAINFILTGCAPQIDSGYKSACQIFTGGYNAEVTSGNMALASGASPATMDKTLAMAYLAAIEAEPQLATSAESKANDGALIRALLPLERATNHKSASATLAQSLSITGVFKRCVTLGFEAEEAKLVEKN